MQHGTKSMINCLKYVFSNSFTILSSFSYFIIQCRWLVEPKQMVWRELRVTKNEKKKTLSRTKLLRADGYLLWLDYSCGHLAKKRWWKTVTDWVKREEKKHNSNKVKSLLIQFVLNILLFAWSVYCYVSHQCHTALNCPPSHPLIRPFLCSYLPFLVFILFVELQTLVCHLDRNCRNVIIHI